MIFEKLKKQFKENILRINKLNKLKNKMQVLNKNFAIEKKSFNLTKFCLFKLYY